MASVNARHLCFSYTLKRSVYHQFLTKGFRQETHRSIVQLAGRKYLPGSESPSFPQFLEEFREDFPYRVDIPIVQKNQLKAFTRELRPKLDELLPKYGALLIRGLPLEDGKDFSTFVSALDLVGVDYVGGSAFRESVADGVSTASDDPPEFNIEPHNEMAYLPYWPQLFIVYCATPPEPGCGGHSGITDARDIYRGLDQQIIEKAVRLGVRYYRYLPDKSKTDYITWQASLMTESREEAESKLQKAGQDYRWEEDGALSFWRSLPAMAPHYRTGEMLWFNQMHSQNWTYFRAHPKFSEQWKDAPETKYPFTTFYGDGSPIEPEVIQHIREVTWRCTVGSQLEKADVVILDNMYVQHSRISFKGPRKNLVSLGNYKEL